ncbi:MULTISPECIES: acyl-CoA dehydrogenase family protein [Brevibacterium]|uniref:Acyl-[acyl-carrier-protein] dehydrogenase MbtN n=1 Tax=Brevibacterium pityocampae TaxID=506594 RepID=A0ABP8J9H6_9MICO|nr:MULTISPECIES: acyl-CoA dehydrogenase family protein [Actinomycetes]MCK1803318.1 acyl-CoA dehydrogenase family protein [Brevibacterium sp. R8603A2]MCX0276937.1 acyl-CoA dehydrogenase family protein [Nocardia zapadnayensis]QCP04313.1 acyl-CoA dehydrogenase [Brevibacterium sp. CS2]
MRRTIFTEEHDAFRSMCRDFVAKELVPAYEQFEQDGKVAKEFFAKMGELGLTGLQVPEEYGGGGQGHTFKFNTILNEETAYAATTLGTLRVHQDLVIPYILEYANEEQKQRWLPGMAAGTIMTAIAMTEPGTGSDLTGIRTKAEKKGDHYVLNGAKTFISGGINADRVLVVARTSPYDEADRRGGLSILVVDAESAGFEKGRNLDKIGLKTQDTAELSFTNVEVPATDLLGEEGKAFEYLSHNLAQERMTISVNAVASAQAAIRFASEYAHERKVFGTPLKSFQNTKFVLAECSTEVEAAQIMLDHAIEALDANELSPADAARVKLFTTEVQARVVDKCLQVHGGYGYILEYPIARLYADARVTRIYGGTSEVMKTIIAKDMGLSEKRA